MKVKSERRSKFSNSSNWKEEAWKNSGLQRDSNPWPPHILKLQYGTILLKYNRIQCSPLIVRYNILLYLQYGKILILLITGHNTYSIFYDTILTLLTFRCVALQHTTNFIFGKKNLKTRPEHKHCWVGSESVRTVVYILSKTDRDFNLFIFFQQMVLQALIRQVLSPHIE